MDQKPGTDSWKNEYGEVVNGVLTKIVIQRDKWIRGGKGCDSMLLNESQKRCCIGFMAAACGVPDATLFRKFWVRSLPLKYRKMVLFDVYDDARSDEPVEDLEACPIHEAYSVNDDWSITEKEREVKLCKFFKEIYNVKVVFIDELP